MSHISDHEGCTLPEHAEEPRIVLAWYDGRKPELKEAFTQYAELRMEPRRRLRHKWTLSAALAMLCIGLSISPEFTRIGLMICAASVLIIAAPWLELRWKRYVNARRANRLARRIERSEFGQAVMWRNDPLWDVLAAALSAFNVNMVDDIFWNAKFEAHITPLLASLLTQTQIHRQELRSKFEYASNDPVLENLRLIAFTAAGVIAKSLGEWRVRQPRE